MVVKVTPPSSAEEPAVAPGDASLPAERGAAQARLDYESQFHDQWAQEMDLDALDPQVLFACPTTPENVYSIGRLGNLRDKRVLDLGCGAG